ncbi:hypothetical protein GYMLUDRAFT_180335, partial [Collybiopsis luxurians FD-317 M1]
GDEGEVNTAALSPDGTQIVLSFCDRPVSIWDTLTGEQVDICNSLQKHSETVIGVAFSLDGSKMILGSDDGTIKIWDATQDKHTSTVKFSPNGTQIVTFYANKIRIWDVYTDQLGHTLAGHISNVSSVTFSPDGTRIVSVSENQTVRIWDAATGVQLGQPLQAFEGWATSVDCSSDGSKIVLGCYIDSTLRSWDIAASVQLPRGHSDGCLALSPDGARIVIGNWECECQILDATTGAQLVAFLASDGDGFYSIAFSPDGSKILSHNHDEMAKVWNATTGTQLHQFQLGDEGEVVDAALSPDGTQIALYLGDRPVSIWHTLTGRHSGNSLQRHGEMVSGVAFSPDGSKMISGSEDGTIKIWDATQVVADLDPDRNALHSVAFNLDRTKVLAVDCTGNLQIYDSISGDPLAGFEEDNEREVKSVAFSVDRTKIGAIFHDGRVRIWDDITANPWHSVEIEDAPINRIAFSLNGSRIALSNWEKGTVSIWAWDATQSSL